MSVEAATWVFMYPSAGARASKAVQRPTATLDTSADAQMYRENSPRLRFSAYSSLNVDTEK
jgi:cytidylate kinase